jgi:hypothetical protein
MMIPLRLDRPLKPGETLLDRLFRLDADKRRKVKRRGLGKGRLDRDCNFQKWPNLPPAENVRERNDESGWGRSATAPLFYCVWFSTLENDNSLIYSLLQQ